MKNIIIKTNLINVVNGEIKPTIPITIHDNMINSIYEDHVNDKNVHYNNIYDCRDYYALPGLIDLHVHLLWSGGDDPVRTVEREGLQLSLLRAAKNAEKSLLSGITTIRDLGSYNDGAIALERAIAQGYIKGPKVIPSGCSIIKINGHDRFWGIEVDNCNEAMEAVHRQLKAGAKVIKVSATGGVYGKKSKECIDSELTLNELKAITNKAHLSGLKVAAHSISKGGIWNCVNADIDTIEHGHFLDDLIIQKMKEKGIIWVPTLYVYRQISKGGNIPIHAVKKSQEIIKIHKQSFKKALRYHLPFAAGSDAGSPHTSHPSIIEELQCMVDYGATNLEALQSATCCAARALGEERNIGTIERGKRADILIVEGNPLEDINYLRNIKMIISGGEVIKEN
jgi:imidazolonepropionase-like amidohydrolase